MQRFHSEGDSYTIMYNGTNVSRVGPGEDMTTVCNQEEDDKIIHALNCGFSSVLVKNPTWWSFSFAITHVSGQS